MLCGCLTLVEFNKVKKAEIECEEYCMRKLRKDMTRFSRMQVHGGVQLQEDVSGVTAVDCGPVSARRLWEPPDVQYTERQQTLAAL